MPYNYTHTSCQFLFPGFDNLLLYSYIKWNHQRKLCEEHTRPLCCFCSFLYESAIISKQTIVRIHRWFHILELTPTVKLATDEFMGKIQIDHALHHLNSKDLKSSHKSWNFYRIILPNQCQYNQNTLMAKIVIVYHGWLKCGRQLSYMLYFIYTYTRLHHGPDFPLAQMWAWSNVTPGSNGRVRGQAQA